MKRLKTREIHPMGCTFFLREFFREDESAVCTAKRRANLVPDRPRGGLH